ncbi:hypothetical protein HNR39_004114 [Glaciimonas immobilis]|uniref:Integrase catalytic domain-containing protein n=1 Tax=Glaciimonas immobilis TaxID=728004 RepID=A0A840S0T7_9BURK|nr:hypothetical protein [Glaciimonas immobilis]
MTDKTSRRYLFVAIDRATRWVYMEIYADQTENSNTDFLIKVKKPAPLKSLSFSPTTAANLRIASPLRKKKLVASIYLIVFARNLRLNIA